MKEIVMGPLVGILLAAPGCAKDALVGKWEVVTTRPNCEREKRNEKAKQYLEAWTFAPDGTCLSAKSYYLENPYVAFSIEQEGRWSSGWLSFSLTGAPATFEVDITSTHREGLSPDCSGCGRITFEYKRDGNELYLTPVSFERRSEVGHHEEEETTILPEHRCSVAYRKVTDLVR